MNVNASSPVEPPFKSTGAAEWADNSLTPDEVEPLPTPAIAGPLEGIRTGKTHDDAAGGVDLAPTTDQQRRVSGLDRKIAELERPRSGADEPERSEISREVKVLTLIREIALIDNRHELSMKLSEVRRLHEESANRYSRPSRTTIDESPASTDARIWGAFVKKAASLFLANGDFEEYNQRVNEILAFLESENASIQATVFSRVAYEKAQFLEQNIHRLPERGDDEPVPIEPAFDGLLGKIEQWQDEAPLSTSLLYVDAERLLHFDRIPESREENWSKLMALCATTPDPETRSETIRVLATLAHHRPEKRRAALETIVEAVRTQKPYQHSVWKKPTRFNGNFYDLVNALPSNEQAAAEQFVKAKLPGCIYFTDSRHSIREKAVAFAEAYDAQPGP